MKKGLTDYQNRIKDKKRFQFSQHPEHKLWVVEDTETGSIYGWASYDGCREWAKEREK